MIRVYVFLLGFVSAGLAAADAPIYEKSSEVEIGKVFFTPRERAALDRKRELSPAPGDDEPTAGNPAADTGKKPAAERPAGYFVSGSGRSQFWSDGDFVLKSSDSSAVPLRFPGDVRIVKHEADDGDTAGPRRDEQKPGTTRER